jgi:hypothetical protein
MRVFLQKRRAAWPPWRRRATPQLWHVRQMRCRRGRDGRFGGGLRRDLALAFVVFIRRLYPALLSIAFIHVNIAPLAR